MSEQRIENKAEEAERIDLIRFLGDFFRVFRRTWIWVLILTVAGGLFSIFGITGAGPRSTQPPPPLRSA